MKALKIINCSDSSMWYRDSVGRIVPFVGVDSDGWWSREPAGYKNIIKLTDAELVDLGQYYQIEEKASGQQEIVSCGNTSS